MPGPNPNSPAERNQLAFGELGANSSSRRQIKRPGAPRASKPKLEYLLNSLCCGPSSFMIATRGMTKRCFAPREEIAIVESGTSLGRMANGTGSTV